MPTKYKLTYFNVKGYAETARQLFVLAGVEYEDKRCERAEWDASIKATSPTGKAPMLEVDGVIYTQSNAINRFLARQFGFAGKTPLEEFRADMIVDTVMDAIKPMGGLFEEKDEEKKAALLKKFQDETLPPFLQNLEKLLIGNNGGDGFFVGKDVTWADILFTHLIPFSEVVGVKIDWSKIPKLAALKDRVTSLPRIAEWIKKRPETQF